MSVIEREQQQVDPVREERARVLEAAALEIEVRGWCQGAIRSSSGHLCAVGAIGVAHRSDPASVRDVLGWGWRELAHFNDAPERTADEVTFVLRWRAAEIRDGR